MIEKYAEQTHFLLAVDCIIFGFDGERVKLLLIQRGFQPEMNKWSLVGGFVRAEENPATAASRVLHQLTGLTDIYMEQMEVFGEPNRDPIERTVSITYFALIDINKYEKQISADYNVNWFVIDDIPNLVFDHNEMVRHAREKLKYKASLHPLLFELLPDKFTIPQIQALFEDVFEITLDKRNFTRKLQSTNLLIRQKDKDRLNSKKGAFYYKINPETYKDKFSAFLHFLPKI